MWASSRRALNFLDRKTPNQERVSNQRTMTAPRHRLSAHQCNSLLPGMRDQLVQSNLKLRRLHVVCIPSKALVPPACIDRAPPGMSQTAKSGHVAIADAGTSLGQKLPPDTKLRERGIVRTSINCFTPFAWSKSMNSCRARVEWPTVKIGGLPLPRRVGNAAP